MLRYRIYYDIKALRHVLSRNKVSSGVMPGLMRKLNQRKIRWIVKELERGEWSARKIAKQQGISKAYMWRLYHRFKDDKHPKLLPCGRKPKPITAEEVAIVKKVREETEFGAVSMEKLLKERGMRMPHNRIHRILMQEGLARAQPNKSRRRKWVRYERRHSNSLWHADWCEFPGGQVILFEDDASRLITGFGKFQSATTENALRVFEEAVSSWGAPRQLMTDHGAQFCSDEDKVFVFSERLKSNGVEHILARVKHPQSNGKVERLGLTMKKLVAWKGSLEEAVKFYNEKRPHMSLENGRLRTPLQAFYEKLRGKA